MIRSIRAFRSFAKEVFGFDDSALGKEYLRSIDSGLIPSAFRDLSKNEVSVTIAPAFTFLMQNRSVDYQFWLDIGSLGWWERLYQPLTNPYVYQSKWKEDQVWGQENDYKVNQSVMERLIGGLLLRCNRGIYASILQTNEFGAQNIGPLLQTFQTFMKRSRGFAKKGDHV